MLSHMKTPHALHNMNSTKAANKVIFGCYAANIDEFRAFALRAQQSGATHIILTAEDLPWARWQYDTPNDPYPSWIVSNIGILKVATPATLREFLPQDYAERVMKILEARCRVLRELGLKAAYTTFEPQVLPEAVYERHPLWRGAQVDEPLRSRRARFVPAIDHPEVRELYRESIHILLKKCPEIEILSLHTNDSGAGISWSTGLYPGSNGDAASKSKKMYDRYRDFFRIFQEAAREMNLQIDIDAEWVREQYPELFAEKLDPGMALANIEGPGGTRYKNNVGFLLDFYNNFHPVRGIPLAMDFLDDLRRARANPAPRLFVMIGDRHNCGLYMDIYDRFQQHPVEDYAGMLGFLREIARKKVGDSLAPALVEVWRNLHDFEAGKILYLAGGTWFYIGAVQQRWLTRPFVPFPEELKPEDTAYFEKFIWNARSEERARSLHDMQGTCFLEGYGGQFLTGQILSHFEARVARARDGLRKINGQVAVPDLLLLDKRLQVLSCVMQTCLNATEYQYYLNVAKTADLHRPVTESTFLVAIPERQFLLGIARREIDNCARLIELLESGSEELLDLAPSPEEEDIRILGSDITAQLRKKIQIMIGAWKSYDRLFLMD